MTIALKNIAKAHFRALIVDNHTLVRAGLKALIHEIDKKAQVIQASSALDALVCLHAEPEFDLVVLDICVPDMDGLEMLRKIRNASASAEIIVISGINDAGLIQQAKALGVTCYLTKDVPSTTLIQTIKSAIKPSAPIVSPGQLNNVTRLHKKLSKRQLQIIQYLSKGMSNKEISQTIFLSEGTIKNHITQIFSFLGVSNRTQAIIEAEKRNLIKS